MKSYKFFLLAFIAIIVFSCGNNNEKNKITINGKLTNTHAETIYLEELTITNLKPIDSTTVNEDGEFSFKQYVTDKGFFVIKVAPNNFITVILGQGENVTITGDIRQLARTYNVENSDDSKLLWEIEQRKNKIYALYDSLGTVWRNKIHETDNYETKLILDSIAEKAMIDYRSQQSDFISENKYSLAMVVALYQRIGKSLVFTIKDDLELFNMVNQALNEKYPENAHAIDLNKRILEMKNFEANKKLTESKLDSGMTAPDFTLPDPEGKPVSLSSKKGKIVLLYFWKSRNTLSRNESPKLLELYEKYKSKGFDIFCVTLDDNVQLWQGAIIIDRMTWTNVMSNSTVNKFYNVEDDIEVLPRAFLLDKEGKIIAKDFRVDELEKLLKTVFDADLR
ncbi:MAG: AhpC/TSA family protein [Saprospiraceae bacterium]|nr:AhpC/TSA family protein [Saprospiraceae bacterium]